MRQFLFLHQVDEPLRFAIVIVSTVGLALVGATDDLQPMEAVPRLLLQTAAVAAVVATLPAEYVALCPTVPWWLDRTIMVVGGVWLVNVVNFMDGIDWMTVAEIVPVTAGLALFGFLIGALPLQQRWLPSRSAVPSSALPRSTSDRPLFLGDVGSLADRIVAGLAARRYSRDAATWRPQSCCHSIILQTRRST